MRFDNKWKYIFLTGIIILLLLPFGILSFFTHPSSDDFCSAFMIRDSGFWNYQMVMYENWCGRYSAVFSEALNPLAWGCEWVYRLIPFILLVLLYGSFYAFTRAFFIENISKRERIAGSLIAFTLFLNIFPGISEGLYWLTGAKVYLLACILILFLISVCIKIRYFKSSLSKRIFYIAMIFLLAIIISGLSEIALLLIGELTLLYLIRNWRTNKKPDIAGILLLFTLTGALIFVLSAPGNFVRMGQFSQHLNIPLSLAGAAGSLIKLSGIFLQNPLFLILSILFLPFAMRKISSASPAQKFADLHPLPVAAISVLILFSLYIPGYLAMGINPPMRIHAFASLFFLLLWFVNLFVLMQFLRRRGITQLTIPGWLIVVLIACAFISTTTDFYKEPGGEVHYRGNIARAWSDLLFRAIPYEKQFMERNKTIETAKAEGKTKVELQGIKDIPSTIFFIDLTTASDYWINAGMEQYYKIDTIVLIKENESDINTVKK
jgi:hypothetical protein